MTFVLSMVIMPLLSIVVPTLDRGDTLRHALATMACQPAQVDCKFIVQNNGGNPEIAEMVAGLKDERLTLDPAAVAADGTVTIRLALSDPHSPADLG
jgi:hypothetical protein